MTTLERLRCDACGAELSARLLVCPSCRRLVHATELNALAQQANELQGKGDLSAALALWRRALELLPPHTRQWQDVDDRIKAMSAQVDGGAPAGKPGPKGNKLGAGLGIAGIVVALLSKAKFLLVGLTKLPTLLSMFVAFGAYWALWGWRFALGFVLCIYVHEIGHVAALRRYGISATAPMFIPGLGAFVRLNQRPATAREDARVGLAGPLWGLAATAVCLAVGFAADAKVFFALAHASAWINLFNLLPLASLDGSRGFASLQRAQRIAVAATFGVGWLVAKDGLLVLLAAVAAWRSFDKTSPAEPDSRGLALFIGLIVALVAVGLAAASMGGAPT